nr:RNA-directed DNA polymerase, eukaryota [Tanacetum cinerariifolium]
MELQGVGGKMAGRGVHYFCLNVQGSKVCVFRHISITWIAWEKVLAAKKNGGLGVSSFFALNRALLLKWVWRFLSQDGSLWFKVIQAMYGDSLVSHPCNQASIWCSILREVNLLKAKGFDFISHCKKRVGDGLSTRFWQDNWITVTHLRDGFPRLFALDMDKEVSVAAKLGCVSLDVSFRRGVRDGAERQQWDDMISLVGSVSLSSSKDRWICDLSGEGEFRVKEVRNFLDELYLPSHSEATRWVKCIPIKINVRVWPARRDCLLTRHNLSRRGIPLDSVLCPFCDASMEDSQHVFFSCDIAQDVFRSICRWWDLDVQVLSSFSDWQVWFLSLRLPSSIKALLESVFCVVWWYIWMFRNRTIFEASPPRRSVIFDDIVSFFFNWCSSRCNRVFSWEN